MNEKLQKIENFVEALRDIRQVGTTSALVYSANNFSFHGEDNKKEAPLIITHTQKEADRLKDVYGCDAVCWTSFNRLRSIKRPILIDKCLLEYLTIELVNISYTYRDDISSLNKEIHILKEEVQKFREINSGLEYKFTKIKELIKNNYPEIIEKLSNALDNDLGEDYTECLK